MDRDVLDTIEREIDQEVRARFPGTAVRRAVLLQYGDDPEIEPGDLWVRVLLDADGPLTRLGPAGLETLDTLIMAGTAATRAEAIRWALDRIRERPAYQRLRELRGDADKLRNEF